MKYATLANGIAHNIAAIKNDRTTDEWRDKWQERLKIIEQDVLPRGSGFDSGSKIDIDASTSDKIVISVDFHHMDSNGCYDGWTQHKVVVRPSLLHGFIVDIKGRNKNQVKEYIADQFHYILGNEYTVQS